MNFIKKFDWSLKSIAKIIGLVLGGTLVLAVVIALFGFSIRTVFYGGGNYGSSSSYSDVGGKMRSYAPQMAEDNYAIVAPGMPSPDSGYSTGTDAENFEVKSYDATIKSRNIDETCQKILALKISDEVIFEYSNLNEEDCSFRFKVLKEAEEKTLKVIQDLNPDNLNTSVESIKQTVEFYEKQQDILKQQLDSIDETLSKAQDAYDEITKLATKKQDVESLATIIDNKLNLIDKLASQRLSIKQQIDQNAKTKAEQLDRLKYSFFNVTVIKDKIFDWKQIKDSWKYELKQFVTNLNSMIQGISVNLATYFVRFIQVAIYLFLSVFLLKYGWIAIKRIWKGKG
jgi:hypothetical protein